MMLITWRTPPRLSMVAMSALITEKVTAKITYSIAAFLKLKQLKVKPENKIIWN